jgi:hypothetical protein
MTQIKTNRVASYKGRKYRLLYFGATKFGKRAHLQFFDGSKDFWVAAENVTEVDASRDSVGNRIGDGSSYQAGVTAPHGRRCPVCGSRECAKAWDPHDLCDDD